MREGLLARIVTVYTSEDLTSSPFLSIKLVQRHGCKVCCKDCEDLVLQKIELSKVLE